MMEIGQGIIAEAKILDVKTGPPQEFYDSVRLKIHRGNIDCRYYPVKGPGLGAIWVPCVGGDWGTPAGNLYPDLSESLKDVRIASLQVKYRFPTILEEAVLDTLAGIDYLQSQGVTQIALVGHSFGGAVVIQAAALSPLVKTVVTLATQSSGADAISQLGPRCSILLIHGDRDKVLPDSCSKSLYHRAKEPKQLVILKDNGHCLDESAADVHEIVSGWITAYLE